jgi:O-antigen ligase
VNLTRVIAAAAAFVFSLPVVATWHPSVPMVLRVTSAILLIASLYQPTSGFLVIAGLLPISMLLAAAVSAPFGGIEAMEMLVAPVLLACALRTVARPRAVEAVPLLWPAVVMAGLIIATLVVQLANARDPGSAFVPWFRDFWRHVSWKYFIDGPIYPPLHRAFTWIWGLALAVSVAAFARERDRGAVPIARMAVFGAAAAAVFAVVRVADFALRSPNHWGAVIYAFGTLRISPHMEPNAAGSFYVLLTVPAVFWMLATRAWWSVVAVVPLLAGLWLTRSRTALLACMISVAAAWMLAHRWSWRRLAVLGAGLMLVLVVLMAIGFGRTDPAVPSMRFRVDMGLVAVQLAVRKPIFGLGLDEFQAASVPLITREVVARFPPAAKGENAHNNFLQILVELGVAGLATFLWLLASPALLLARAVRQGGIDPIPTGVAAGLLAFLLTCLSGHPLMVPQAALPFLMMLGLLVATLPRAAAGPTIARRFAGVCVGLIAITLVFRLASRI